MPSGTPKTTMPGARNLGRSIDRRIRAGNKQAKRVTQQTLGKTIVPLVSGNTPVVGVDVEGITAVTFHKFEANGDGSSASGITRNSATQWTLDWTPAADSVLVWVSKVPQFDPENWSISGAVITFTGSGVPNDAAYKLRGQCVVVEE